MPTISVSGPAETLFDALLRADPVDATEALEDALDSGFDPIAVLDDVMAPAMHEIGRWWENGTIGVAEEHLASSVANRMLTRFAPLLITSPARSGPRVLLACAQGERHVLGLQMACDVLEGAGYAVKHAGADLPANALLSYAERDRPALVALSCTGSWAPAADIRSAIGQLIEAQPGVSVVLGGAGWRGFEAPDPDRVVWVANMRDLLGAAKRLTADAV
jgi:MerR family transcriptional regulator, light-induced transcriptional regulator